MVKWLPSLSLRLKAWDRDHGWADKSDNARFVRQPTSDQKGYQDNHLNAIHFVLRNNNNNNDVDEEDSHTFYPILW